MRHFLFMFSAIFSTVFYAQKKPDLIPYPQNVTMQEGKFIIPETLILNDKLPKEETEYFKKRLGSGVKFQNSSKTEGIHLMYMPFPQPKIPIHPEEDKEKYTIDISPQKIFITSNTRQGYFLALQTLAQLFEEHKEDREIPVSYTHLTLPTNREV